MSLNHSCGKGCISVKRCYVTKKVLFFFTHVKSFQRSMVVNVLNFSTFIFPLQHLYLQSSNCHCFCKGVSSPPLRSPCLRVLTHFCLEVLETSLSPPPSTQITLCPVMLCVCHVTCIWGSEWFDCSWTTQNTTSFKWKPFFFFFDTREC